MHTRAVPSPRPSPRELIEQAVDRYGLDDVRAWCERLVLGESPRAGDPDLALLGGDPTWARYWFRVWGVRAFRYVGPPPRHVLERALGDEAWRVREHALAIVAETEDDRFLDAADAALDDPVARVRLAALRVVGALGEAEHAEHARRMSRVGIPPDRVDAVLGRMAERLDRPL